MSDKIKTIEELGEDVCEYCPLEDNQKGVHCYGGEPVMCVGCCPQAYEAYLDDMMDTEEERHKDKVREIKKYMEDGDVDK